MTVHEALQSETLIDATAFAEKLNVHPVTIRKWQGNGKIPAPVRIGRSVKWRLREIEEWIAADCPARSKWEIFWKSMSTKSRNKG